MATYLSEILAHHRAAAQADRRAVDELVERARQLGTGRGFRQSLAAHAATAGLAVIAEVKRRSPSKGDLAQGLDPAAVAGAYAAGGASALSVLTDATYFGGSPQDLAVARAEVSLPVLRKDFTVCPADVADARLMGADAVLLIVAALTDGELDELHQLARAIGLDALVEVHDEAEAARALAVGAELIGVNQRDLTTFAVDPERAERVVGQLPAGVVAVAESGISGADDARRMADAGYQAILVGEALVRATDRAGALGALVGHPVGDRRAPLVTARPAGPAGPSSEVAP